jgi:magnesium transporter
MLHRNAALAAVVALAILFICMWANSVGALVPILARRFGIDPAVISAPLISTLVDATGLIIFYTVAIVILIKLAGTGGGVH